MAKVLGARCPESSTGQPCVVNCPRLNFAQFETDEEAATRGAGEYYNRRIETMPGAKRRDRDEAIAGRQRRLQEGVDRNTSSNKPLPCGRKPRP